MKERLDILVSERGLAESREKAQRLILAGQVTVDGQVAAKAGHRYDPGVVLAVKEPARFVGRGGEKLDAAMEHFRLDVRDTVCLDVGASTGGFTDCLLQRGAAAVYAVDVGKGQLHWNLRNDPRVRVMEAVNARYMEPGDLAETPGFACVDVSFISLTRILPAVDAVLAEAADVVTLIKPQFEAGRDRVEKGGVVRDPEVRQAVIAKIRAFGTGTLGWAWRGAHESPLRGPAGNVEFLACWRKGATGENGAG